MKKILLSLCLFSATAWMVACTKSSATSDEPTPDVPDLPTYSGDTVAVRIAATSLEWNVEPMSRAGSNDLYGIMVYQTPRPFIDEWIPQTLVAVAVFDDPSLITLKLAKSQYYHIRMTYVPNGKNVIASRGTNKWGCPFYMPYNNEDFVLNQILYGISVPLFLGMPSQAAGQKEWMMQYNVVNEVLRYEGQIRNFQAAENGALASIPLYRWQYGTRITVTDFKEGTVYFSYNNSAEARKLTLTPNASGTSTMEHLLEYRIPGDINLWYENSAEIADNDIFGGLETVKIGYIDSNGKDLLLWSSERFPFKRMHMYTLEFSVADAIANGGIQPELMENSDAPMTETPWEM